MLVMTDETGGVTQGGVVRFPLSFASGIMRARFNPRDGQLYVSSGLGHWLPFRLNCPPEVVVIELV